MRINGNLVFNTDATGELQNVFIERLASAPSVNHTLQKGRIYFNTNTGLYYFSDGTAWQPFATGGNATLLQQYLNNLIASIGGAVNSDGTWNGSGAFAGVPFISGATSITNALTLLANEAASSDTLAEMDDVSLSTVSGGQVLMYDGNSSTWTNHTLVLGDISDVTASAAEVNVLEGIPLTLTSVELGYVDGVTSPIQVQLDNKQPLDSTLTALSGLSGSGIIAQTGVDTFDYRSLIAPEAGFTITNADGVAGNPTFALANDLAALEGLASTGYIIRTGDGTATTRAITGQTGRIVVTNGDGVASNTDIDLEFVEDTGTGTFVKITRDAYGRVIGTQAVETIDVTTLVDSTYVNVSGDTMTGSLVMSGAGTHIVLPNIPTSATHAVNKAYVDSVAEGLQSKPSTEVIVRDAADIAALGPYTYNNGVAGVGATLTANANGAWPEIDGFLVSTTTPGQNGILIAFPNGTPEAVFNGRYNLTQVGNASSPWVLTRCGLCDESTEIPGAYVFVRNGDIYAGTGWVQVLGVEANNDKVLDVGSDQIWLNQFAGASTYTAGTGLDLQGTIFSVNLGAGIFEGPTDAVGIDLWSPAAGALMLTDDGSTRTNALNIDSKLHLKLRASGGLVQDVNGLYVPDNGIVNSMILNNTMGLNADSGTGSLPLGETLFITGTSAQGIKTSVSGTTFAVSAEDAAYAQKGVASFDANNFTVVAGDVTLKTAGVANSNLEFPYVMFAGDFGTAQQVNLGQTITFTDGGTHADPAKLVETTAAATNSIQISVREAGYSLPGVASFSASDFTVVNGAVSVIAKDLDSLTDVEISTPSAGDTLVYAAGTTNAFVNRPTYHLYSGSASVSHVVNHNLNQKYCNVTVVDDTDEVVIPQSITFNNNNTLTVTFTAAIACKVVVMGVNTSA